MKKEPTTKKVKQNDLEDQLLADLQRIQAEFINFKRRAEEEKARAVLAGKEQAVIALLPVLDNIERAIAHEPEDIKDHAWVKGVSAVALQLESQLENIGLTKVGVVGEPFDPNKHEAISMADGEGETEVVSAVLQNGYEFNNQVLRPAMVQVKRS
jgi:molecular chaperone GrpE